MKKTILIGLLTFFSFTCALVGCNQKPELPSYTVTFKQDGIKDFSMKVTQGESLFDVPTPNQQTGYTVVWDRNDFTNINSDIVVNAVKTANSYTITYSAEGFDIDKTTAKLTYDSVCSVLDMSLTSHEYNFVGWQFGNSIYTNESIWNVAKDVTLSAVWTKKDQVTITFVDTDGSVIIKTIVKGEDLTDIPTPTPVVGYKDITWDRTDFSKINENIVVKAVKTAKTYTVNLDANGGSVDQDSITVTFDQPYLIEVASHQEFKFLNWRLDGEVFASNGIWKLDESSGVVNLVAEWGDSEWSNIY